MELGAAQSLAYLGPELVLAATALVVWLQQAATRAERGELAILGAAVSLLLAAGLHGWGEVWLCQRLLVVDGVALFAKIVVALAVVAAVWIDADRRPPTSDAPRLLVAGIGLELMASAANVWMVVATVELVCLALVPPDRSPRTATAVSCVASLAIVASLAWLSGLGGASDFEELRRGLLEVLPRHGIGVSILSSTFFVASLALFVLSTPQGVLAGVGFPAALLGLTARFFLGSLAQPGEGGRWIALDGVDWQPAVALAAVVAMIGGGAAAVRARTLGRLLAAASVANAGYALGALGVASVEGLRAALVFSGASAVPWIGAWFVAARASRDISLPRKVCAIVLLVAITIGLASFATPLRAFATRSANILPF